VKPSNAQNARYTHVHVGLTDAAHLHYPQTSSGIHRLEGDVRRPYRLHRFQLLTSFAIAVLITASLFTACSHGNRHTNYFCRSMPLVYMIVIYYMKY